LNRLSRAHERYRRQTTDGRAIAYSERELKINELFHNVYRFIRNFYTIVDKPFSLNFMEIKFELDNFKVKLEGLGHSSKFMVIGRKCCYSGHCDLEWGLSNWLVILPRNAHIAHHMPWLSIYPVVRPSHRRIVQKRQRASSSN